MGLIQDELSEVRAVCENQVPGTKVVAAVKDLVRIEIEKTKCKKLACCFMFPNDYPNSPILFELKSKTLSGKLLDGLTRVTEQECKKHLGRPQILFATKFINTFIEENPLCCCSEEISKVKKLLGPDDVIKLSQKNSAVNLTINKERYFLKCKVVIPDMYPEDKVDISLLDCNFPRVFRTWFLENAKELARRCVEAPLKPKPNAPPFVRKPSLEVAVSFLVTSVQRYPVGRVKCAVRLSSPRTLTRSSTTRRPRRTWSECTAATPTITTASFSISRLRPSMAVKSVQVVARGFTMKSGK